LSPSV